MRTIQISPDVFQAIWAGRVGGEDDEDTILRRLLAIKPSPVVQSNSTKAWVDTRSGTRFPEGFQIFRRYLGKNHSAQVFNGEWRVDGRPIRARSVNELSRVIGTKTENAWVNWNYTDPDGQVRKISDLRST